MAYGLIEAAAVLLLIPINFLIIFTSLDVANAAALWGITIYMHILRQESH